MKSSPRAHKAMTKLASQLGVALLFIACIAVAGARYQELPPQDSSGMEKPTGQVKGTVKFFAGNEGSLHGAKVTLESKTEKHEASTDENGTYLIQALPGVYRITVVFDGFCDGHRAEFQLRAHDVESLDFTLLSCAEAHGHRKENPDALVSLGYVYPYKEELIRLTRSSGEASEIMIRYGGKEVDKERARYEGTVVNFPARDESTGRWVDRKSNWPVMVTYNVLTIYANKVCIDPRTLKLAGDGDVILEDGKQRKRANHVEVDFGASNPMRALIVR